MRYIKNLTSDLSFNVKREEIEMWQSPEIQKAFNIEFARKNSTSAKALLPMACVLSVIIMIVYSLGVRFRLYSFQLNYAVLYLILFVTSVLSFIVISCLAKDIEKNDKKILTFINVISAVYTLWVTSLLTVNRNLEASTVVYAATVIIITQGIYLAPRYSLWFVFLSTALFLITSIFGDGFAEFDYESFTGIVLLSFVSYAVSCSRYYNRCRAVYNKILVKERTKQLDEMLEKLQEQKLELEKTNYELEQAYVRDSMTGLYNRWFWNKNFENMLKACMESEHLTAVFMLDVDNFKSINDTKGHAIGDRSLVAIADVLYRETREISNCSVFRMGGEEFLILCSDIDKPNAIKLANAILKNVQNIQIQGLDIMLTVSVGVHIQKVENRRDLDDFTVKADKAMYESKNTGKNKITFSF